MFGVAPVCQQDILDTCSFVERAYYLILWRIYWKFCPHVASGGTQISKYCSATAVYKSIITWICIFLFIYLKRPLQQEWGGCCNIKCNAALHADTFVYLSLDIYSIFIKSFNALSFSTIKPCLSIRPLFIMTWISSLWLWYTYMYIDCEPVLHLRRICSLEPTLRLKISALGFSFPNAIFHLVASLQFAYRCLSFYYITVSVSITFRWGYHKIFPSRKL